MFGGGSRKSRRKSQQNDDGVMKDDSDSFSEGGGGGLERLLILHQGLLPPNGLDEGSSLEELSEYILYYYNNDDGRGDGASEAAAAAAAAAAGNIKEHNEGPPPHTHDRKTTTTTTTFSFCDYATEEAVQFAGLCMALYTLPNAFLADDHRQDDDDDTETVKSERAQSSNNSSTATTTTSVMHLNDAMLVFVPLEMEGYERCYNHSDTDASENVSSSSSSSSILAIAQVSSASSSSSSMPLSPLAVQECIQKWHSMFCIWKRGGIHGRLLKMNKEESTTTTLLTTDTHISNRNSNTYKSSTSMFLFESVLSFMARNSSSYFYNIEEDDSSSETDDDDEGSGVRYSIPNNALNQLYQYRKRIRKLRQQQQQQPGRWMRRKYSSDDEDDENDDRDMEATLRQNKAIQEEINALNRQLEEILTTDLPLPRLRDDLRQSYDEFCSQVSYFQSFQSSLTSALPMLLSFSSQNQATTTTTRNMKAHPPRIGQRPQQRLKELPTSPLFFSLEQTIYDLLQGSSLQPKRNEIERPDQQNEPKEEQRTGNDIDTNRVTLIGLSLFDEGQLLRSFQAEYPTKRLGSPSSVNLSNKTVSLVKHHLSSVEARANDSNQRAASTRIKPFSPLSYSSDATTDNKGVVMAITTDEEGEELHWKTEFMASPSLSMLERNEEIEQVIHPDYDRPIWTPIIYLNNNRNRSTRKNRKKTRSRQRSFPPPPSVCKLQVALLRIPPTNMEFLLFIHVDDDDDGGGGVRDGAAVKGNEEALSNELAILLDLVAQILTVTIQKCSSSSSFGVAASLSSLSSSVSGKMPVSDLSQSSHSGSGIVVRSIQHFVATMQELLEPGMDFIVIDRNEHQYHTLILGSMENHRTKTSRLREATCRNGTKRKQRTKHGSGGLSKGDSKRAPIANTNIAVSSYGTSVPQDLSLLLAPHPAMVSMMKSWGTNHNRICLAIEDAMRTITFGLRNDDASSDDCHEGPIFESCLYLKDHWLWTASIVITGEEKEVYIVLDSSVFVTISDVESAAQRAIKRLQESCRQG